MIGLIMPMTRCGGKGMTVLLALTSASGILTLVSLVVQLTSFNYLNSSDAVKIMSNSNITVPDPDDNIILNDKYEHVFVFVQVTDLHISKYFDPSRGPDFEVFCNEVIDTIKPEVTLVTGDLTDARTRRLMAGQQFEEEWKEYHDIVERSGIMNKTTLLDIRGNHDDFNVFDFDSPNNFFKRYSVSSSVHRFKRHYSWIVKHSDDAYAFIAVDACLSPGPNRPFNTVGMLHQSDIQKLNEIKHNLTQHNMTIWFGHYPTRAITSPDPGLSNIIDGPYLSGHVHMLDLYAYQKPGFIDIELADWRAKRMYRVAVVDHNVFSFSEATLHQWPVIVITNPKPAAFLMPEFESVRRIRSSTHIRAMIFSTSEITSVRCQIDQEEWIEMDRVADTPLHVAKWDPAKYLKGLHHIRVQAIDKSGKERTINHHFAFDGTRPGFNFKSKLIMTYPHQTSWGLFFWAAVACHVIPLIFLRLYHMTSHGSKFAQRCHKPVPFYLSVVAKLFLLTSVDKIFLPLICVTMFLSFGPWMYADVAGGHYAFCFVWGILIEGHFLPGGVSYVLGSLFIILVIMPFTMLLSHATHVRLLQVTGQIPVRRKYLNCRNAFAYSVLFLHFFLTIVYADGYGVVAWITGFAHTWTLVVNVLLWRSVSTLDYTDYCFATRSVAVELGTEEKRTTDNEGADLLKERTD